jgi:capsid protein
MTHAFSSTEDESQTRGVTWFHAALLQGKDLHEYTGGVVQQARVAAHTLGFLEKESPDEVEFNGAEDDEGNEKAVAIDVAPLSMNELPAGYKLSQFDPKQPTQNHSEFKKSMVLDIAAALGVNGLFAVGRYVRRQFQLGTRRPGRRA